MGKDLQFRQVITSEHKTFDLKIKETLRFKDLIFLFVKRDFIAYYKQTILGPLWAIIQPLLTTIVFTIIFGSMAKLTTADINGDYIVPAFLFYMTGNICWSFFSSTLQATSDTFIRNQRTMGKVYYPRLVAPIATALSNLIAFGIQLALFIVMLIVIILQGESSIQFTPKWLMLPLVVVQLVVLAVGCGIILSSVTTKYRDLAMLVGFGLQLWQYGSPIAYGLQLVPTKYMSIYMLNPVTTIVTTFRYAVFGFGYFNLSYYLLSWGISVLIFFIGLILFSKVERTFMDTI